MSTATATAQATLQEFTSADFIQHKIENLDNPYTNAQVLRYLYWECAMSTYEIAERLGPSNETIRYWMEHHNIERRKDIEAQQIREIRDGPFSCQSDNTTGEADSSTESKWSFQD